MEKRQKKWAGEFSLILNDGSNFPGTAGRETRLCHWTNASINSITLLSAPAGKLPLVEIGYGGQSLDFRMFRNGDGVELCLARPIKPTCTPTDLMLAFEVEEDELEVVAIEIRSL